MLGCLLELLLLLSSLLAGVFGIAGVGTAVRLANNADGFHGGRLVTRDKHQQWRHQDERDDQTDATPTASRTPTLNMP